MAIRGAGRGLGVGDPCAGRRPVVPDVADADSAAPPYHGLHRTGGFLAWNCVKARRAASGSSRSRSLNFDEAAFDVLGEFLGVQMQHLACTCR